jgi:hypothetical protein
MFATATALGGGVDAGIYAPYRDTRFHLSLVHDLMIVS